MKYDLMRRSDVFFLAILFSWIIAIGYGIAVDNFDHMKWFQLVMVFLLAIGAFIKTVPNPLREWFIGDAFRKKPGILNLDQIPPMAVPMYDSYRDFPRKGQHGQFYYARDVAAPYMWSDHHDRYLRVVQGEQNNEDHFENFGRITPQGATGVQPPWNGNLPPPTGHLGNVGAISGQGQQKRDDGSDNR